MSYAGIFWLPFEGITLLVGLLLVALGRPLGAAILGALVSIGLLTELQGGWAQGSLARATADGVLGEHLVAAAVHERADWAAGMLAWVVPPLLLCALGAILSARQRRRLVPLALFVPASAPSIVLLTCVAAGATRWSADDPRWTLRYLEEWRAAGRPVDNGGPCADFLANEADVALVAGAEELAAARTDCRSLCEGQATHRGFNPGMIEAECAARGVRAASH